MEKLDQALKEVQSLHERVAQAPAPPVGPQAFLPFPPGVDPVAFAVHEVEQLRQLVEAHATRDPRPLWTPRASVFAGEQQIRYSVEISGVAKDDVTVTVHGGELVVRGERRPSGDESGLRPMLVEQTWGPFERRFPIPAWVSGSRGIEARCANGMLEIDISRHQDSVSEPVQVKVQ